MASMATSKSKSKNPKVVRQLKSGLQALSQHDYLGASSKLAKVVEQDRDNSLAWRMLAYAYEKQGNYLRAFDAYGIAARLNPDNVSLLRSVGQLAYRLSRYELSEKLLRSFLAHEPHDEEGINSLACTLREMNRYGDAVDVLREALGKNPEQPGLWNILGSVLAYSGDTASAITFFDEALRLAPHFPQARYNRAEGLSHLGNYQQALSEFDLALKDLSDPKEVANVTLTKAFVQLISGDLVGGFESYEARTDWSSEGATVYKDFGARWQVGDDLTGKTLLVYAEQGLGDEVLFANVLNDTLNAVGLEGRVYLAAEPRLVPLFQRSFPRAVVRPYQGMSQFDTLHRSVDLGEAASKVDLWVPMASLFRRFRTRIEDFPKTEAFLTPDPERVVYWRQQLADSGPGPYVGILWKSMNMNGTRQRHYSPFDQWGPVLKNTKARFVNLQYADAADDLSEAKARGFDIWTPPGIDLKMDIDDLAALCAAMDVVIGPSTATTNIAAAVGTKVWISAGPGWWTCFGTDYAPCYPSLRLFRTNNYAHWPELMEEIGAALEQVVEAAYPAALKAG